MDKFVKALEYCKNIFDGTHETPKPTNSGHLLITSKHLLDNALDYTSAYKISEKDYVSINRRSAVHQWDILFSMIGTVGTIYLEKNQKIEYAIKNVGVFSCRDEYRAKFLFYYLQTPYAKKWLNNYLSGAVQKFLSLGALKGYPVLTYEPKHQNIVDFLSALDKKIELNNQINQTLEQMAKTLYDYWFVQFDFPFDFTQGKPDPHGKPYKSSGGKMVYNEELKREIPEGWEVKELSEVITRSGTGLNPRDNFKLGSGNNYYITIKSIKNGKIIFDDKCDKIDDEALKIINKRSQLQAGDILFTSIEPVGVTYLLHEKPTNWDINESVFTIRANTERVTPEYLYMLLSSIEMQAFTKNVSAGSYT